MALWQKKSAPPPTIPASGGSPASADATVIGPGFVFKGDIVGQGRVRLMGRMEGRIDIQGEVAVGREAFVQGEIKAGAVAVEGRVEGRLEASQGVALGVSARVTGSLVAGRVAMAAGACLNGDVAAGAVASKR